MWPPSPASRRCSTAGSRRSTRAIHGGLLADRRLAGPPPPAAGRRDRAVRARRRQPLPVRGRARAARDHGRRADRGDRHRRPVDGPGGREEPRQRRDRDVAGAATRRSSRRSTRRRRPRRAACGATLAIEAFAHTAAYDARIAEALPGPDGRRRLRPARRSRPPRTPIRIRRLTIGLEKVETLRYGENPHQPAARYRRPGS